MTFLWQLTKDAYKFSDKEEKVMRWFLNVLIKECPRTCSFLNQIHLEKMEFYWAPYMTSTDGVMGAWCITTPNRIYMRDMDENSYRSVEVMKKRSCGYIKDYELLYKTSHLMEYNLCMTFIHELIHKLQFQCAPVPYIVNRLVTLFVDWVPYLERIGIEYDARVNSDTEELKEFVTQFWNSITSYQSAVHNKLPDHPENWLYKCWNDTDSNGDPIHSDNIKRLTLEYFDLMNSLSE